MLEAERVAEATKQAIKRKIAQAASVDFQSRSLPPKLRIDPDDPEDVVSCSIKFSFLYVLPIKFTISVLKMVILTIHEVL